MWFAYLHMHPRICNTIQQHLTVIEADTISHSPLCTYSHSSATPSSTQLNLYSVKHTGTYCNTLVIEARSMHSLHLLCLPLPPTASHYTLQQTAAHCNTLQHTAIHCNTLHKISNWGSQHASHAHALPPTATHCNTQQHTSDQVSQYASTIPTLQHTATHSITLHHTALHCITLYHTVSHCNKLTHSHPL